MLLEYTTLLHCCNPRFTHHHHGVICSNICQLPAPLLMLECEITSLVSICLTHFVYINRGLAHSVHYIKSIIYRTFTPNVQQLIRYLIFISKNVIPYYGCGRVSTHRSAIHGSTSAPIFVCICLAGLLTRAELLVLHGGFARSH